MSSAQYLTIDDIELFYTGGEGHPFQIASDLVEIAKGAGDFASSVTGALNRVYGALLWSQINQEANMFGALPKTTWVRSGWRVKKAFGFTASGGATSLGVTETGALPAPVYPDIQTVYAVPKMESEVFDVSDILEALATATADDVYGAVHAIRAEIGTEFVKGINQQILHTTAEVASSGWSNQFETLDRVVSTPSEFSTTTFSNVYNLTRTGADTWSNANVDFSSTLRSLTDNMMRVDLQTMRANGGNPTVAVTGYDTYAVIQGMYYNFVRYLPLSETKAQFGVNGVMTGAGIEAGIQIASLYGVPLIQSVDAPNGGGTGEISRLFFLDTSDPEGYGFPRLGLSILRPLEYFETRDFVLLNKFVIRGVYRIIGETVARNLHGQTKIRDITA